MTLLLVTTAHPSLSQHPGPNGEMYHPNLGRLVTPRHYSSIESTGAAGIPWAADNDCFQGLDAHAYNAMLDRIAGVPGCRFVVVPDVVADAVATARQFEKWSSAPRRRGLPAALVAQDGLEEMGAWLALAWPRIDALFIGGSTEWKLSDAARLLALEAQRRGKWVHWGRVNTARRIAYVKSTGAADSFDGSSWARWRTTYLPGGLTMAAQPPQLTLYQGDPNA